MCVHTSNPHGTLSGKFYPQLGYSKKEAKKSQRSLRDGVDEPGCGSRHLAPESQTSPCNHQSNFHQRILNEELQNYLHSNAAIISVASLRKGKVQAGNMIEV